MIYKIVNPTTLEIRHSYEADAPIEFDRTWDRFLHIAVPQGLDPDCVKAIKENNVVSLVEDATKTATKIANNKQRLLEGVEVSVWEDILDEMQVVYGTRDMNSATAYHLTWKDMIDAPSDYVGQSMPNGDTFADAQAVTTYAAAKIAASRTYAKWRLTRLKQSVDEANDIING